MPFKSKAQRRKFYAMVDKGEMSPKTLKHWEEATKAEGKPLPEKVEKTAFWSGFDKKADALTHAAELAGLGILAIPSIALLAGKHMGERKESAYDAAGLGTLALPSAYFLGKKLLRK